MDLSFKNTIVLGLIVSCSCCLTGPMSFSADTSAAKKKTMQSGSADVKKTDSTSAQKNKEQPKSNTKPATDKTPTPFPDRRGGQGFGQPMPPGGLGFPPGGFHRGTGSTLIQMSFDKADIQSVIKFLSMISKTPIVVDPELKGNITIISSKGMSVEEAYDVINAALMVRGYTMSGAIGSKVIKVIPLKRAITDTTNVGSGKQIKEGVADFDIVTQIIPLEYISSDDLSNQLKPLISTDQASLVSVPSTNTLIVTDTAANVKRLMQVVNDLDRDTTGIITVEVYKCQYASADNLVSSLNTLFQTSTAAQRTTQARRRNQQQTAAPLAPGMPGAPAGQGTPSAQASTSVSLTDLRDQLSFTADARTNRLIISGTKERIDLVLQVVKQLDVDTESEVKVKFFPLQYADAQTAADQLNSLFEQPQGSTTAGRGFPFGGGAAAAQSTAYAGLKRNLVVADMRTNSLIVTATEQNMKAFDTMIKELDAPKVLSEVTRVYPLKYAKAEELTTTLTSLFRGNTTSGRRFGIASVLGLGSNLQNSGPLAQLQNITVVAEPKTNSLLVTGPPNSAAVLDDLIKQLDKRTAQVFIEVAIVDVTLDKNTQFGVEWQWHSNETDSQGNPKQEAGTDFGLQSQSTGLRYSVLSGNLQALLRTLQTQSNVRVLSTPTITTSDNVQAKISIGQDQPFVSQTTETSGGNLRNTVDFKNVSISLQVTPHVNGSTDLIGMEVQQTINEIIGYETALNAPIIANRQAVTTVSVNDGQTIVIGGIIKENTNKISKGVPVLSSIPIVGELFKTSDDTKTKSELMVFLTPRILKTDQDIDDLTKSTRSGLSIQPSFGSFPKNPETSSSGTEKAD